MKNEKINYMQLSWKNPIPNPGIQIHGQWPYPHHYNKRSVPTLNNPGRQQSVAAVAVIREEVGGLRTAARGVSGRRRRTGGWCIILYINGRKSPRWHVGGLNQAANIDGSDLPLLTRPFLILVPNQVYLGLCLDFMRPFKSMSQRDMSFAHTPLCPDNARHCFNFFQAAALVDL